MQHCLLLAVGLASLISISAKGAIFEFYLHGQGGNGLRGSNHVPANSSTATGGEVSSGFGDGITFDDSNNVLTISAAYGSHYGFNDLLGNYQTTQLRGPAEEHLTSATVVLTLDNIQGAASPTHSGLVFGSKVLNSAQREQLMSGLLYLNVRSDAYSDGELRANLVPIPEPAHYTLFAGAALAVFVAVRHRRAAGGVA